MNRLTDAIANSFDQQSTQASEQQAIMDIVIGYSETAVLLQNATSASQQRFYQITMNALNNEMEEYGNNNRQSNDGDNVNNEN